VCQKSQNSECCRMTKDGLLKGLRVLGGQRQY
jgi:hypothetical protein